jgi:coenzyme F420-dependent glucose-6-phosphate dehydrogenase
MLKIAYHCSHEQFKPSTLLKYVQMAEQAGFNAATSSDHFYPWSEHQGESGFAWSWLGAALQATRSLTFGVVNAPGQRYHPAIIAQASATLAEMYPERFWIALGTGQAMNEHITGTHWPAKEERNARLLECATIIRQLWKGEKVNHRGRVVVEEAQLYTRPEKPPLMVGAALTEKTAEWVGTWADALITVSKPKKELQKMIDAFYRGGGEGKPLHLKVQLSYAKTEKEAKEGAFQEWKSNIFESHLLSELIHPKQFDAAAVYVKPEDLYQHVNISASLEQHLDWIKDYMDLGFSVISLHNVNRGQEQFMRNFGEKVVPALLK